MLFIRPYKQDVPININKQKTRKHEIVKHQSSKIELSNRSLNTSMYIFNKETEKAWHFSAEASTAVWGNQLCYCVSSYVQH